MNGCLLALVIAALPPVAGPVEVVLPDYLAEVRAFRAEPPAWNRTILNAGWGGGRGAPERHGGWLAENWKLIDYLDRSGDYTTHRWLRHRGIYYEVYGANEYQETIHFHAGGALPLFGDNGIARDLDHQRVLSEHYNLSVKSWAAANDFDAYIVDNNAPRWSAVIDYDWLTSPILGDAISQDNIGGPTSRIGSGSRGRYCDYCDRKFRHHLATSGRLPDYLKTGRTIRDYVNGRPELLDKFRKLPPQAPWPGDAEAAHTLCDDPVLAEYQRFQHLAQMHNLMRYYREVKMLAARSGKEYDVHGNLGGGFNGFIPYQTTLRAAVDTIWFESAGLSSYDLFKWHWSNAWGPFRFEMGEAMSDGRKPVLFMCAYHNRTPDIVSHEWAEACAGGGVLFPAQNGFEDRPELLAKLTDYYQFRADHRAVFEPVGRSRHCQVAVLYSVPTFLYQQYVGYFNSSGYNDLGGVTRALEEGHVPYDLVILDHPDLNPDELTAATLKRYRVVIAPSVECLSTRHAQVLREYLAGGGVVARTGLLGIRDEDNRPLDGAADALSRAGKVVDLLPGDSFPTSREKESDDTRARTGRFLSALEPLLGDRLIAGGLPRMLWVKTWRHADGFVSAHFVNYDISFESGQANPTPPTVVTVRLPDGLKVEEAAWLEPGAKPVGLPFEPAGPAVRVTIPSVRVYGVLVVGRRGLDADASARRTGERYLLRACYAAEGLDARVAEVETLRTRPVEFRAAAEKLLDEARAQADAAYIKSVLAQGEAAGSVLALDFGAGKPAEGWRAVTETSAYTAEAGYGWLPCQDTTEPTPEERWYGGAYKYGGGDQANTIRATRMGWWPYPDQRPTVLETALYSGRAERFRLDLPDGRYRLRVITGNPSWSLRNFLVSGMVWADGGVMLGDAPHDKYVTVAREFVHTVRNGAVELTFGGPTGWGVAGVVVFPSGEAEAGTFAHPLTDWRLSDRYANPEWWPIGQVRAAPEADLGAPPLAGWREVTALPGLLPVVDLGTPSEADIGDVLYAATIIQRAAPGRERLTLGATSAMQVWLNGEPVAYLPNLKGLMRDEAVVPVTLRAGRNVLLVKVQRFWERRWMFYAAL